MEPKCPATRGSPAGWVSGGGLCCRHGLGFARVAPVVVGVVGAQALEALVHPKILFGYSANLLFQQAMVAFHVVYGVGARKILECGPDHDAVSGAARQALREVGQYGGAGDARQPRRGGVGGRRDPEKVDHCRALVAVTLIRRIPHRLVPLEGANHRANVVVCDGFPVAQETGDHGVRQEGVLRGAIHHVERHDCAQDAGGDFDGGEVAADQNGAVPLGERCRQMLETQHFGQASNPPVAAPPGIDRHCESLGIGLCETANAWWSSNRRVRSLAEVLGLEHLTAALAKGHGAILIGGHFTTIEIATRILGTVMPLNVVYRPTKNALLSHTMVTSFLRNGKPIAYDDIRSMIRALKRNEAVWYAPDQSYRNKGAAMVNFFGIPAATNTATSRLARISGAPVLTYFAERLPGSAGYRVMIGPAFEDFPSADPVHDVERYHRLLEEQIRRIPEQYLWVHQRFKGLSADYPDYYGRDARKPKPVPAAKPAA